MQTSSELGKTANKAYDLLIVGGGINGCGIAADAAGRGLSVMLCEKDDLASATSSASSKLIHGGLRYLEYYEFRLVREALAEREVLLKKAPHIVTPMRFILPHRPHLRPAWMIRSGLFLYDHLGKRKALPSSTGVKFDATSPLKSDIKKGFVYSDCWVDDARLVLLNAMDAANNGAAVLTRTECIEAKRHAIGWEITLVNTLTKTKQQVFAKTLVNAAGPWVESFIKNNLNEKSPYGIRLIKGSHIVVPKLYDGEYAYILQNEDKRVVFVIPYQEGFSLIGTTDLEYNDTLHKPEIEQQEINYLVDVVNQYFNQDIQQQDIVNTFSGVRPLCDDESSDPSAITRDYTLTLEDNNGSAPLLSIFGGKITTYRKLAEAAIEKLSPYHPNMTSSWTKNKPLPGGDIENPDTFKAVLTKQYPWLPAETAKRYSQTYGSLCHTFLTSAHQLSDLGEDFGHGLFKNEVDYLVKYEWAITCTDILWRRTKLGLFLTQNQANHLNDYLTGHQVKQSA